MPWRPRPRAALLICLPCAIALAVVAGVLRAPAASSDGGRPSAAPTTFTIDDTLTPDADGCSGVRSTVWHPLSGIEYTGRLDIRLPAQAGGGITLFVGDAIPLAVTAELPDGTPFRLGRQRLASPVAPGVPPDYWLDDGDPWRAPHEIVRVTADARPDRALRLIVSLGRRAPRVVARLTGYPASTRATVCAKPVERGERVFATGWSAPEPVGGVGAARWMGQAAVVLLSSERGGPVRIRVNAAPANHAPGTRLQVRVNDVYDAPPLPMREGFADYTWTVPGRAWVAGTNELLFTVSRTSDHDGRTRGMALASLDAQ